MGIQETGQISIMKFSITAIFVAALVGASPSSAEPLSYNRDIRPILSDNCFTCHGPDKKARKGGLRLDVEEVAKAALKSGATPIVVGDHTKSTLYQRITTTDTDDHMPPSESGKTLSPAQIETLTRWLDEGAVYEPHWAYITPRRPELPAVQDRDWLNTPVDNFILSVLEVNEITPSVEADKITLLRRVYLDLTGLPPTPDEVAAFVDDVSDDAYEKVVDHLLASPHFGERWARHWLDAARYADSNGYSIDSPRSIWAYRDYVINAFNQDLPFDQFVIEQMAGDLLPDATLDQKVATGFHRNTMINEEGGVDTEEFRIEAVADRVETVGTVFLGLTMGCSRCHDHKYDPLMQAEYFNLFAYLNNDNETTIPVPNTEEAEKIDAANEKLEEEKDALKAYLTQQDVAALTAWEEGLSLQELRKLDAPQREALLVVADQRNDDQKKLATEAFQKIDKTAQRHIGRIDKYTRTVNSAPTSLILARKSEPRETHLLLQGDYTRPGDVVFPGVPRFIHNPEHEGSTRLDLAQWLVDKENPLLARVTVNRFWQRLFGIGIVETENDFGLQGTLPSNPELIDWLAVEFMDNGWHIKPLLKTIVLSATYKQASVVRDDLQTKDPLNTLLARQNRVRLDAEVIRDATLIAADKLDPTIGGPSVYPPQPEGVTKLGQRNVAWNVSKGGDRYRRGIYTAFLRSTPYYALTVFDAPNAQFTCTRRVRSNTPLQALTLLNDEAFFELAQALTQRMYSDDDRTPEARIEDAFRFCLSRTPTRSEQDILMALFNDQRASFATASTEEVTAVYEGEGDAAIDGAAWTMVARALLNLDEFVTRE